LTCEFKEVGKGQSPIQAIGKTIDRYAVAFLNETAKGRDELRQVAGQNISKISPPVHSDRYSLPFHQVVRADDVSVPIEDRFVIELHVEKGDGFFLTGGGESYSKTLGGLNKLSGAQIHSRLYAQLHSKVLRSAGSTPRQSVDTSWMPTIDRRASVARPLIDGARALWVDDNPSGNIYERLVLASFGIVVDLAMSTEEALYFVDSLKYDVILSDMRRNSNPTAGLDLLQNLKVRKITSPVVFYVGHVDQRSKPVGAFSITDRADELLHYVFDVLERRNIERG
jgi:CheY-like chemotaxis protein